MSLEIIRLEKQIYLLSEENKMLKQAIQQEFIFSQKPRRMSNDAKRRWKQYHDNKEKIQGELGSDVPWYIIKKKTDEMES